MNHPANDPSERPDPSSPEETADASGQPSQKPQEESGLAAGLRHFSRRLATFGLGEAQEPLLTEQISSFDTEGNPR